MESKKYTRCPRCGNYPEWVELVPAATVKAGELCPKCGAPEHGHCERYNGWTNYETWNVKLWMDNDQGDQCYWAEQADQAYDQAEAGHHYQGQTKRQHAEGILAAGLRSEWSENVPDGLTGPYADLMQAALDSVNWYEIAAALLDEKDERDGLAVTS